MRYDLYYIKHMSAWLDVWILLQTVRTIVSGREAPAPLPPLEVAACPAPLADPRV